MAKTEGCSSAGREQGHDYEQTVFNEFSLQQKPTASCRSRAHLDPGRPQHGGDLHALALQPAAHARHQHLQPIWCANMSAGNSKRCCFLITLQTSATADSEPLSVVPSAHYPLLAVGNDPCECQTARWPDSVEQCSYCNKS